MLLMLTTGRRFSPRCVLVSVMVPSPSMIPAIYAASTSESVFIVPRRKALACWTSEASGVRATATGAKVARLCRNSWRWWGRGRLVPDRLSGREPSLVEAGGQHIPQLSLRAGLCLHPRCFAQPADAERVIRTFEPVRILVLAPGNDAFGESMSLYRAGLKLALFLPLGVAMPLSRKSAVRFHRCELRCSVDLHRPTRPIDRTPVRKR